MPSAARFMRVDPQPRVGKSINSLARQDSTENVSTEIGQEGGVATTAEQAVGG